MEGGKVQICWWERRSPRGVRGKKSEHCRCGKTIEAKPVSGQTCLIEPADGLPETLT